MGTGIISTATSGAGSVEDASAVIRPRLRGWLHEIAFIVAIPAAGALVLAARTGTGRLTAAIYGMGLCAVYGVSAAYHRGRWSARAKQWMKRLDHGTIFVMIAGTYTPICALLLHGSLARTLLITAWAGAALGMALALSGLAERSIIGFVAYLILGWVAVLAMPQLLQSATHEGVLLLAGGVAYTLGAAILAGRWPNPFPRTFGYHEVWHSIVIAASACHYLVILAALRAA